MFASVLGQIAVKRLEAECEHRLELERNKLTALQEQYAVLEQRLATSNGSLANLEKQFQDYKSALRNTKESDLLGQIFALKQQCCNLERKFELAIHSRDDYKCQVCHLCCGKDEFGQGTYNMVVKPNRPNPALPLR